MKKESPCVVCATQYPKKYATCSKTCPEVERLLPQMRDGELPAIDAHAYYEDSEGMIHGQEDRGD